MVCAKILLHTKSANYLKERFPLTSKMPTSSNTLLIEGGFEELADELAQYIDDIQKKQNPDASSVKTEIGPLLEQGKKDDALKKLVTGSAVLNSAPEKGMNICSCTCLGVPWEERADFLPSPPPTEFIAAYNLLVHLVVQSPNLLIFLPKIIPNLCNPISSSPANGPGLSLSILTTIFNILPDDSEARYHVFLAILRVVRSAGLFEVLRPQLKNLDSWIRLWDTDEEDQRSLFLQISEAAHTVGDDDESYTYLLRALRTIPAAEASSPPAHDLAIRATKAALSNPSHFVFQDLTDCDAVQSLRHSADPSCYELLELFNSEGLEDYTEWLDSHPPDFLAAKLQLDQGVLMRKMRLLTLASLAAAETQHERSLPYARISRALNVPAEDVEMWVIDVIRAGLVEGKLSQLNQTFLIHRSTYRVFGEKQWIEVQGRLDTWRASLEGVLSVIKQERLKMLSENERDLKEMEGKMNGGMAQGRRGTAAQGRLEFDD